MTHKCLVAIGLSLSSAVALSKPVAANVAAMPAVSVSPVPLSSLAPANEKLAGDSHLSTKAPHLYSAGRKSLPTYGYMKQASDDRDGLSRLQDQARQLRPPR